MDDMTNRACYMHHGDANFEVCGGFGVKRISGRRYLWSALSGVSSRARLCNNVPMSWNDQSEPSFVELAECGWPHEISQY